MPYVPIVSASGTYFVAVTAINRDGVTEYMELVNFADPISGACVSVTAPGSSGTNAMSMQGIVGGVPLQTVATGIGTAISNVTSVLVGTSSTSLLSAVNPLRIGFILYCEGPSVVYFTYAATTSVSPSGGGVYSSQLSPGDRPYVDTIPYFGLVSGMVGATADPSYVQITEITTG